MKYVVVTADTVSQLEAEVMNMLGSGWKVAGGVAVSPNGTLLQAMVIMPDSL